MKIVLPAFLIHAILALSAQVSADVCEDGSSSRPAPANEVITTPLTLWDLGFSLKEGWADLREQEECPVRPDLICVDGGSECGDQQVLEDVASMLHPTETGAAQAQVPAATEKVELEEDLVSFEDWKRRKQEEEEADDFTADTESTTSKTGSHSSTEDLTATTSPQQSAGANDSTQLDNNEESKSARTPDSKSATSNTFYKPPSDSAESPKPHSFSKYNYASPDCSARIHSSSPSTQHASSLLHKSRDRYMLTPCKADQHWVVVELCDEIRVEAIEIAVWEFFSGVVRDVRISVGGADEDEDDEGDDDDNDKETSGSPKDRSNRWEEVGSFVGKNVRGVQTFTLTQPTSFHRFIRLDFPSFYGTEYYCPVSQVKVYGMNQMEAFKWEQKRQAATAKDRDKEKHSKDREAEERRLREKAAADERAKAAVRQEDEKREKELDELEKLVLQQARLAGASPEMTSLPKALPTIEVVNSVSDSSSSSSIAPTSVSPASSATEDTVQNATTQGSQLEAINTSSSTSLSQTTTPVSYVSSVSSKVSSTRSDSSESIYAQIVRRLNALEGNSSLVARYIEEQAKVMRVMLTRVERGWDEYRLDRENEEHRRWEQERMRQEDRLGQVISQMEQQRVSLDLERKAILSELRVLSSELGYERRRGIAQLLITLVIIIIGAGTRSSAIDKVLKPLVVEARRRRSVYKSFSGPLAGLAIDMGSDRPPAVIGQPRPRVDNHQATGPTSPTASATTTNPGKATFAVKRSESGRRPITPSRRRTPHTGVPPTHTRVFSDHTPSIPKHDSSPAIPTMAAMGSPFTFGNNLKTPKPRVSLPPPRLQSASRKLARSAHLHTMEADRVRRDVKGIIHAEDGAGETTPRRPRSIQSTPPIATSTVDGADDRRLASPLSADGGVFSDSPDIPAELDQRSDWGTDAEGSVSDIDGDLHPGDQEVVRDLLDIWGGDDRSAPNKTS